MKSFPRPLFTAALVSLGVAFGFTARAEIPAVANVPAKDPAATNVPPIVPAMRGVHPRLLFNAEEIKALKQQIATDPTLRKAYTDGLAWCKGFRCPAGAPDIITQGDTPAIWKSLGFYPVLAYIYALDRDPEVKQKIIDVLTMMLEQPYWSPSGANDKETDNSMGAACNMEMVALLYDSVYNDLAPELRSRLAAKILLHCRRMFYLGHRGLGLAIKYWQADPQPNHRWYRDAGLGACLLAIADEKEIDARYLLQEFKAEMDFVMKWYPPDGDCHEGAGYQNFGYVPIATAAEMSDRILGTNYLKTSGLKNAASQQLYYRVPGRGSDISFGDDQNSGPATFSNSDAAFFLGPHLTRDKDTQAALVNLMTRGSRPGRNGSPFVFQWAMLAFYDPTVCQGSYRALPTFKLFPDLGAASMRDSWEDDAVVFTFKCGPYGGYKLNDYRMATPEGGKPHYINVAHDDPDANEFAMSMGNGFAFHPGVYSVMKVTRDHNTITVDDKGQLGEGDGYTQPTGALDMRQLSYLTGWKTSGNGRIIIEGEAGNAYRGVTGPELKKLPKAPDPVLNKFRRTAIWMPGEYILILDDIAAAGTHKVTWRGITPVASTGSKDHYIATTETGGSVEFQLVSNQVINTAIDKNMVLDGRWGKVPVQQFQFSANTQAVKFACLLDPWKKNPELELREASGTVTLTVRSRGFNDIWTWQEAKDSTTPSKIDGRRNGTSLISLTEADKAPKE